jgi:hypothetical protein
VRRCDDILQHDKIINAQFLVRPTKRLEGIGNIFVRGNASREITAKKNFPHILQNEVFDSPVLIMIFFGIPRSTNNGLARFAASQVSRSGAKVGHISFF